jgi:thiol-disulfide isomerase/thioredoxin
VQLVYDSAGVAFGGASAFRVVDGHAIAPIVAQLDSIFSFAAPRRCLIAAQGSAPDPADAVRRDSTLASALQMVRQLLRADAGCQVHPQLGQAVLALFTPTSPLWQLDDVMQRRVVLMAARHAAGQPAFNTPEAVSAVRARFDASIAVARDTAQRFDLYVSAAGTFMPADTVAAQSYTARFVAESYAHPRVLPLLRLTGYNRVLRPGNAVPAFNVSSLDAGSPAVSNTSMLGRVYLLDVWATWCRDCIVELPAMRALQARYAPRGLQLVSISVDEQQATASRFRSGREQMPWIHGWAGVWPDGEGPLAAFEVAWLPTTILVGKDGRILALAPKLESPEFAALVEQALR